MQFECVQHLLSILSQIKIQIFRHVSARYTTIYQWKPCRDAIYLFAYVNCRYNIFIYKIYNCRQNNYFIADSRFKSRYYIGKNAIFVYIYIKYNRIIVEREENFNLYLKWNMITEYIRI